MKSAQIEHNCSNNEVIRIKRGYGENHPKLPKSFGQEWHPWSQKLWADIFSSPISSGFFPEQAYRLVILVNKFLYFGGITLKKEITILAKELQLPNAAYETLKKIYIYSKEATDQPEHISSNHIEGPINPI